MQERLSLKLKSPAIGNQHTINSKQIVSERPLAVELHHLLEGEGHAKANCFYNQGFIPNEEVTVQLLHRETVVEFCFKDTAINPLQGLRSINKGEVIV